mgnify:CR=1 FL=1|jgi:hypothetical protein
MVSKVFKIIAFTAIILNAFRRYKEYSFTLLDWMLLIIVFIYIIIENFKFFTQK